MVCMVLVFVFVFSWVVIMFKFEFEVILGIVSLIGLDLESSLGFLVHV